MRHTLLPILPARLLPAHLLPVLLAVVMASPVSASHKSHLLISAVEGDYVEVYVMRIIREAYMNIGEIVDFKQLPPKRALYESNAGMMDAELIRVKNIGPDAPNLIRIEVPVTELKFLPFYHESVQLPAHLSGWTAVKPYSLAIVRGLLAVEKNTRGFDVYAFNDMPKVLQLVDRHRYDMSILPQLDGTGHLRKLGLKHVKIHDTPLAKIALYHYLHKKNRNLVPALTRALKTMRDNGRMDQIKKEFIAKLNR